MMLSFFMGQGSAGCVQIPIFIVFSRLFAIADRVYFY